MKQEMMWDAEPKVKRKAGGGALLAVSLRAPSWFLARQQAAILLHADPDELDVRPASA